MTTYIKFTPDPNQTPPFTETFILDGASYSGTAFWNFAAQRWYLRLIDQSGNVAWNGPILGSPETSNIHLALGVFTSSTILYRATSEEFEITP